MKTKVFEDKHDFESFFLDDLDSWFNADIACCENCYDDFLSVWPHADFADDAAFQRKGIHLDYFYSGSRLQEVYSEEEFNYFIKQIHCPRCDSPLSGYIWPYQLPLNVDKNIEDTINEIAAIAGKTPFLLLKHPFSEKVLSEIQTMWNRTKAKRITQPLYRARATIIRKPNLNDFNFPPKEVVKEGRYNHAGIPVLYLASDAKTCYYEMREIPCTIVELEIHKRLKILDFVEFDESTDDRTDTLKALVYSALISSKQDDEGWHKPKYIFSRFVADCAKYVGFDGIKYPSTRELRDNYNLVILNSSLSLSKNCEIKKFVKVTSAKDIR